VCKLCFAVSVAGLVTMASPPAWAQARDTLSAAQRAGFALAHLGGGQRVRIWQKRVFFERQGQVVSSSGDLLTLRVEGARIEVPASDVDSLWVRRGNHAGTGALIGGVVAGLAVGAFGAAVSKSDCEGGYACHEASAFFGGLLIGGVMGSGVGALIGAAVPRWQRWVP